MRQLTRYYGAGLLAALDALPGAPEPEDSVFLPALDVLFGNAGQGLAGREGKDAFRKMRLHVHPHALREQNAYYHPGNSPSRAWWSRRSAESAAT